MKIPDLLTTKHRRPHTACVDCHAQKKRCTHTVLPRFAELMRQIEKERNMNQGVYEVHSSITSDAFREHESAHPATHTRISMTQSVITNSQPLASSSGSASLEARRASVQLGMAHACEVTAVSEIENASATMSPSKVAQAAAHTRLALTDSRSQQQQQQLQSAIAPTSPNPTGLLRISASDASR